MDWNLEDPLWLDVDDPEFHHMAELGRIVKMGFVKDVPGLYFHKRFKGSGHPFYDIIYEKAAKINKTKQRYIQKTRAAILVDHTRNRQGEINLLITRGCFRV